MKKEREKPAPFVFKEGIASGANSIAAYQLAPSPAASTAHHGNPVSETISEPDYI
jgi:hypothetical protein